LGTAAGTQPLETESRLQFQYVDGTWAEFYIEIDKYIDDRGERQRSFPINRRLPAGTVLIVHQRGGSCLVNNCQDTIWRCTHDA
jgi:hypothetical protein